MTTQDVVVVTRKMWHRYRWLSIYAATIATLELIILLAR